MYVSNGQVKPHELQHGICCFFFSPPSAGKKIHSQNQPKSWQPPSSQLEDLYYPSSLQQQRQSSEHLKCHLSEHGASLSNIKKLSTVGTAVMSRWSDWMTLQASSSLNNTMTVKTPLLPILTFNEEEQESNTNLMATHRNNLCCLKCWFSSFTGHLRSTWNFFNPSHLHTA